MGGPALVLVLEKTGAVGDWRSAIGPLEGADKQAPESLRAMYAGTGGGDYNTDILGLYNTYILTAITPKTFKLDFGGMTAITPGILKF